MRDKADLGLEPQQLAENGSNRLEAVNLSYGSAWPCLNLPHVERTLELRLIASSGD